MTLVRVRSLNVQENWPGIDNLTLASVAAAPAVLPEPAALALVGMALSRRRA